MTNDNLSNDLGPLEPLLEDPTIIEIMVNGPDNVFVERRGQNIEQVDTRFDSEEHLLEIIHRILEPLGRVVDESNPICDARLEDGSRVNIVLRPIAITGTTLTIRKMYLHKLTMDELIGYGSITAEIAEFLRACIQARLNIVVAGGTGSGKTTVFNELTQYIPEDERVVTVENAAELRLNRKHLVRMESRPANIEGRGEVSIRDLVINSLRMRPDRILIGEVRSGEALEIFQAMNTGHDGSMFTMHANSPRDALNRLEIMATMAGMELPLLTIREQMASALDIIVHQQRLRDGTRKILTVAEVTGLQGAEVAIQDIFEFVQTGFEDGRIIGHFTPTGNIPRCSDVLKESGWDFPDDFFTPTP